MEPPLCVVSNWIIRVYTILVWNTISGSSNLDICCYHCLILTLIFHLKVLINFFFFFFLIFIIIIINSIIGIIIIITTITTITIITIISITTTTTSIIIIIIVIVIVIVIVVVLLLLIIYTINLPVVRPRSCRVFLLLRHSYIWEKTSIFWSCQDRCRRAAVNEDCRGSPKPWAVEEIVVGSSLLKSRWTEKEAATMSTEERKGVKTGVTGPWALSLTAFVEDGDRCRCFCGCRLGICLIGKSILCVVICEDWRQWIDSLKWRESRESLTVQETSNRRLTAGHEGGNFVSAPHFGTIAKSVLKSWFCAISSDFYDFTRFYPFFIFSSNSTRKACFDS